MTTTEQSPDVVYAQLRRTFVEQRERLGVSQVEIARRMGKKQSEVSELETGAVKNPGFTTVLRWAQALELDVSVVVTYTMRVTLEMDGRTSL